MVLSAKIDKTFSSGFRIEASIEIPAGGVTILFGPSGAGKTTVLRAIAGLEKLNAGSIVFKGESWTNLPAQKRPIGYVFQDYALFSHLTVRDNIAFGIRGKANCDAQVQRVASAVRVDELLSRRPAELSGGQQQRVAIARALAREPQLLLLDEPLSALDAATRDHVRGELSRFLRTLQIPAVVVTHNWEDALSWGDRLIVMKHGRVLQSGSPEDVFMRPANADVASIVGVETVVPACVKHREGGALLLQVRAATLQAADPGDGAGEYIACIRGENVILEKGQAGQSSARNHLRGRIVDVSPMGPLFRVTLDVGFSLVASVTRQAIADMGLGVGEEVLCVFKASAVHLIPRL